MNFKTETARTEVLKATHLLAKEFGSLLNKSSDAIFRDARKNAVYGITGLDYYAPVVLRLLNDSETAAFLKKQNASVLFTVGDTVEACTPEGKIEVPSSIVQKTEEVLKRIYSSSGKLNEKGELVIDLKSYAIGSHYPVNLLLGDRSEYADCLQSTPKSVLDHFGRGSFRGAQERQVLATRYELSPEVNGEPVNRQFYLFENNQQIFYSADANTNVESACCTHSQNHTVITYKTECGLTITRTIFILPQQDNMPTAVEAQLIQIENNTDTDRELTLVATGMFGITDPGTLTSDIVYANLVVESELYIKDGKSIALAAHHKPAQCQNEKRFAMLLCDGEPMDGYTSNYYEMLGNGSIDHPAYAAHLSNQLNFKQAGFFAMSKDFTVKANSCTELNEFVGMSENNDDVREEFDTHLETLYHKYSDSSALHDTLNTVLKTQSSYAGFLQTETGNVEYDSYISHNLPFQVLYQTYVSRSFAWTQKSYRETGFREIQDIYASMYYMHAQNKDFLVRKLIASWIENVFEMGYSYHNFTSRGKEPGMCSDDSLWLVQAVYRYVTLTGDTDFLKAEFKVAGSNKTRRLLDTMDAIITYSGRISVGKHNMPLLDRADWNDTLRLDHNVLLGPEKEEHYNAQLKIHHQEYGVAWDNTQSESVMNACLLKIACDQLKEMADSLDETKISANASEISDIILNSVQENAWKKDFFARCLLNDEREYKYLGSTGDGLSLDPSIDGSYYLNSYSWSLLAGIATEEQMVKMLDIIDQYLKTPAGLKLCTLVDYSLLGIVTGTSFYFPGDRENGGVFKHAAMMATVASLKAAKTVKDPELAKRLYKLAYFMIDKTLPYKTLENPYVLKGNPRFCTQYNNSETNENIGPILSGTASWLTLAIYELTGIEISGNTVSFNPVIEEGTTFRYTLNVNSHLVHVIIDATKNFRMSDSSLVLVNGKDHPNTIPLTEDEVTVEIRL